MNFGAIIGAILGTVFMPAAAPALWGIGMGTVAGLGVGLMVDNSITQQKAQKSAEKKVAAATTAAAQTQLRMAGQDVELTKEEMKLQMGQRKIQGLMDALNAKQPTPRVFTLPSAVPEPTWADKINSQIHSFLTGG